MNYFRSFEEIFTDKPNLGNYACMIKEVLKNKTDKQNKNTDSNNNRHTEMLINSLKEELDKLFYKNLS